MSAARVSKADGKWTATEIYRFPGNKPLANHWSTPVHHDGYLYSVVERGSRNFACFSLAGRTNTWISTTVGSGNPGFASLIKVGGKLLVLTEPGELVLLEPNPAAYTEIAIVQYFIDTHYGNGDSFHITDPYDGTTDRVVRFVDGSVTLNRIVTGVWSCSFDLISVI
jgi:hypothetical protein